MRFDFRVGREGVAYVTDSSLSGIGGIIVIDLATGVASKRLVGHVSTSADAAFVPIVEGQQMRLRNADGSSAPFTVAADGIALSPDGGTLFYTPLSSRHLYSVSTALLRDPKLSEAELAAAVVDLGDKGASDGMEMDANGRLYASDYEHNAIHARDAQGDGRRWCTTRASCGRIRCRWGRTAICTSPPTSCIDRPASMVAWIAGRRRTWCIARVWMRSLRQRGEVLHKRVKMPTGQGACV